MFSKVWCILALVLTIGFVHSSDRRETNSNMDAETLCDLAVQHFKQAYTQPNIGEEEAFNQSREYFDVAAKKGSITAKLVIKQYTIENLLSRNMKITTACPDDACCPTCLWELSCCFFPPIPCAFNACYFKANTTTSEQIKESDRLFGQELNELDVLEREVLAQSETTILAISRQWNSLGDVKAFSLYKVQSGGTINTVLLASIQRMKKLVLKRQSLYHNFVEHHMLDVMKLRGEHDTECYLSYPELHMGMKAWRPISTCGNNGWLSPLVCSDVRIYGNFNKPGGVYWMDRRQLLYSTGCCISCLNCKRSVSSVETSSAPLVSNMH